MVSPRWCRIPRPTPSRSSDLSAPAPKVVAEIPVPTSVVGPPLSVAITPDESLALVTSAMQIDPADKTKQIPTTTRCPSSILQGDAAPGDRHTLQAEPARRA